MNLNWKLGAAFATGAVLASGIVYFGVRPDGTPVGAPIIEIPRPPVLTQAAPTLPPVPAVAQVPTSIHHVPVREKPSPMPPPVRHRPEVVIAHNDLPPAPTHVEAKPESPPPTPVAPPPAVAENLPVQNVSLPATNVETRVPHTVTLAAGTVLPVRIGETLSSARNRPGDTFLATLTQPLVIDGWIIAERGARLEGRVVDATQAGRATRASHLGIALVRLATADGQNIRIRTEPFVKDSSSSTGTDAAKIGGGAALGAIIGAIAGGGRGAVIGAGAGGAVGAGDVLLTRGKPAEIPVETRVSCRVQDSVIITERLD